MWVRSIVGGREDLPPFTEGFLLFMSDRDREVVGEAARERIRPVEEAGKMLEWDWGSERLAVAESCLCHPVSLKGAGSGSGSEAAHARWISLVLPDMPGQRECPL